jgi:hypothetical protein
LKAFGQENYSGVNDEFAVLYKYKEDDILKDIGVFNKKQKLVLSKPIEAQAQDEIQVDKIKVKKIVILGADNEGNKITLFLQNYDSYKKVKIKLFSNWGVVIEEQTLSKLADKMYFEVKSDILNDALYLQLYDENDSIISNKHLLNNVSDLWNTSIRPTNPIFFRST